MLNYQFKEDAGPLAHPIRPESYASVESLYTSTVYGKGAEIIRMYHTILGVEGFRKGMDLYFERNDGKAVTSDDFLAAMADANGMDLSQFGRWYTQAGTPRVRVEKTSYNPLTRVFSITLSQHTPPTPGQPDKLPLMIPIKLGLIGINSKTDLLDPPTQVLILKDKVQTFRFLNIKENCWPSVLRDFSAPVKLKQETDFRLMAFYIAYDTDPVNKWRAVQQLASSIILSRARLAMHRSFSKTEYEAMPREFIDALKTMLFSDKTDTSVKALTLRLPEMAELEQNLEPADPTALHHARRSVIIEVATVLKKEMTALYEQLTVHDAEQFDRQNIGRRRLRNELLWYLSEIRDREAAKRAYEHFSKAGCMTDKFYALFALTSMNQPEREVAFDRFYVEASGDAQMIDTWFRLKAAADLPDQIERVALLQDHPAFSLANPNRLRSLLFAFKSWNSVQFHRRDGKGYRLIADAVLRVDKFNSVMAASLAELLGDWRHFTKDRQTLIVEELRRISEVYTISKNVREVVSKALGES